jgi:hypothetical protein
LSSILGKDKNSVKGSTGPGVEKITPDQFAAYFTNKVNLVREGTASAPTPTIPMNANIKLDEFNLLTPADVVKLISAAPNKHCALDPAPTWLIKKCSLHVAPFITMMCNKSLQDGYLPVSQKTAIVTPLLKKDGLDPAELKNYRPVSNLSFLSKLVERAVSKQMNDFLDMTGTLPSHQSAYRKYHSTETALLKVLSDLATAADRKQLSLLSLLDLSAAFDTVDHDILIRRLNHTHGFDGTVLKWIQSYLTDRTQRVVIGESSSVELEVEFGVPQGSVLGPILFLLYTVDIMDIIHRHGLEGHCYADDTQTYIHCSIEDSDKIHRRLIPCIDEIDAWMASNRLKLNGDKTEFIWIGSKGNLQKVHQGPLNVSGASVLPATCVRDLGVYIDSELSMKNHINRLTQTCYFQLRQLRVIRRSLTHEATRLLLHAFVVSRLDYCNSLFTGLPIKTLNKLQLIQNAAARLYHCDRKLNHITPIMKDKLHWLRIPERIKFKLCTLVFKARTGLAPAYLGEQCIPVDANNGYLAGHRSVGHGNLFVPRTQSVTYGSRAFRIAGPIAWNALPDSIKNCANINLFKAQLKTHLFAQSYPN